MSTYKVSALKLRAKVAFSESIRGALGAGSQRFSFETFSTAMAALVGEGITPTVELTEERLKEWEAKAHEMIDLWDARSINRLVTLFPNIVAKKDQGKLPSIYIDDDYNYMVEFPGPKYH